MLKYLMQIRQIVWIPQLHVNESCTHTFACFQAVVLLKIPLVKTFSRRRRICEDEYFHAAVSATQVSGIGFMSLPGSILGTASVALQAGGLGGKNSNALKRTAFQNQHSILVNMAPRKKYEDPITKARRQLRELKEVEDAKKTVGTAPLLCASLQTFRK